MAGQQRYCRKPGIANLKAIMLSILLLTGCATADYAQLADVGTTAIAINSGFVEGNPVWGGASWPVMLVVKLGMNEAIKHTPTETCEPLLMFSTMLGSGAALWNIGIIAWSGPAAIPVAAMLWAWQWDNWTQDSVNDCQKGGVF